MKDREEKQYPEVCAENWDMYVDAILKYIVKESKDRCMVCERQLINADKTFMGFIQKEGFLVGECCKHYLEIQLTYGIFTASSERVEAVSGNRIKYV